VTQIRPDELIRILRGELEAIGAGGGGAALLGYDENGAFAGGQAVAGANSIGMGDTTTVSGDYAIVGGGRYNAISAGADYSVIGGGRYNRITNAGGDYSTMVGGQDNLISATAGWNFIGGGRRNIISGVAQESIICTGRDNIISAASLSFIGGGDENVIADGIENVICGGYYNRMPAGAGFPNNCVISGGGWNVIDSLADYASIPGGIEAKADKWGQVVAGGGYFAAIGDAQGTIQIVTSLSQAAHVVNTWYRLMPGDIIANRLPIAASTAWTVHCLVVGITQSAAQQWSYELVGLIERDNANNTTLAGQTSRTIFESDANYNAQLAADDVNEALEVQVRRTGGVDYDVRWVATIRMAEVTYP